MRSLLAAWRVSALRTRADWPVVAGSWLIMLLAAALFAAAVIYPPAAAEAGLRRALADAAASDVTIEVSGYALSAGAAPVAGPVESELRRVIAPVGGPIVRDWRLTPTFGIERAPNAGGSASAGDRAILGLLDDLPDHATLVAGAWPADEASTSAPIQVAVPDAVARALQLRVGDAVSLVGDAVGMPPVVAARIVGVFAVNAPADPFWGGDPQLVTGIQESGATRFLGPFLTTEAALLSHVGSAPIHLRWRALPQLAQLRVADVPQLGGDVVGLAGRLQAATGETLQVTTGLGSLLGKADRSLLVSRTGVLLVMAQLAILAAYAIALTASLLVDHRRIETSMLRSRGAGAWQVAALALGEGIILAIPAILVAPWLAVGALKLLNAAGPLADAGLGIEPQVTPDAYLVAGIGALLCIVLLVLLAARAAGTFATEQSGLSRAETRTFGQRVGLDVALMALTGIALWQLRLYGAPLTRTVQGTLGLDPLLVAAPAIGLLAGGVLALRILPLLAQAIERAMSGGRGLVSALGSRELARRPLRYTRAALLLMLAMSMGAFATSYAATWSSSQRDQAAYQVGADVRLVPGQAPGALPAWAIPSAVARLTSAAAASPVERISGGVSLGAGSADLLAIDADAAPRVVLWRPDESEVDLPGLMAPLRSGRPSPDLAALPDGATLLRVVPRLDITSASRLVPDPRTGQSQSQSIDPRALDGLRVAASAIVRDGSGLLYHVTSGATSVTGPTSLTLALQPSAVAPGGAAAGARLQGPIQLAGVGLTVWLPDGTVVSAGTVGVAEVSAGVDSGGPWSDVPLATTGAWSAKIAAALSVPADVPAERLTGTAVTIAADNPGDALFGNGDVAPAIGLTFVPSAVVSGAGPIPVVANRALLASLGATSGATITATVEGRVRSLVIAGVVDSFPTMDPSRPFVVMDEPTLGLLRLGSTGGTRSVDEWWLAAPAGGVEALATSLRGAPIEAGNVASVTERTQSLSTDPVALGILGILTLGFVATGLFAAVGLTVSAGVSARQRRTEFALLRALGLSGRQLSVGLWLENGSLVLASLVGGTGLGLVIGWLVLPFVTVTQRATAPIPPIVVAVPWDRILVLDAVTALALGLAVVVIGSALRRLGVGSVLRMGSD